MFSRWRPTGGAARLGVWTRPPALYCPWRKPGVLPCREDAQRLGLPWEKRQKGDGPTPRPTRKSRLLAWAITWPSVRSAA